MIAKLRFHQKKLWSQVFHGHFYHYCALFPVKINHSCVNLNKVVGAAFPKKCNKYNKNLNIITNMEGRFNKDMLCVSHLVFLHPFLRRLQILLGISRYQVMYGVFSITCAEVSSRYQVMHGVFSITCAEVSYKWHV